MLPFEVRTSATAHAADASAPESLKRLRIEVAALDHVICASESVAQELLQRTGRRATAIVHCGITPKELKTRPASGVVRLLSVGRLVEKKGFFDCVAIAGRLKEDGVPFTWRFIGTGPLESALHRASSDLVQSGHVTWMGAKSSGEVMEAMETWADVFVLPSKPALNGDVDGIPVVLMEAMTSNVAVVTTRVSGIPELVQDSHTGLLAEPGDLDTLDANIRRLIDDGPFRTRLASAGKRYVDRMFNQRREAEKLCQAAFAHPAEESKAHTDGSQFED